MVEEQMLIDVASFLTLWYFGVCLQRTVQQRLIHEVIESERLNVSEYQTSNLHLKHNPTSKYKGRAAEAD
jgi:hypothetical protein